MAKRIKTGEEAAGGVEVYHAEKVAQWARTLDEHDHSTDANGTIKGLDFPISSYVDQLMAEAAEGLSSKPHANGHHEGASTHTDEEYMEALIDDSLWESGYLAGKQDGFQQGMDYADAYNNAAPQPDIPFSDEPPSGKLPPNEEEGYRPDYDEGYNIGYAEGVRDITHGNIRHQLLDMLPPFNNEWLPSVQQQWLVTWGMVYIKGDQP